MATFAIGDIQGCYDEFRSLLATVRFNASQDHLILVGDLVNRGPRSLEVLRYVKELGPAATAILGNHDLHLLAVAQGATPGRRDTLDAILGAPDRDELLDWLAHRPLAHWHAGTGHLLLHAGLAPDWTPEQAIELAAEASAVIAGRQAATFFRRMYGDQPDHWQADLSGFERTRFVVNCFTRIRYLHRDRRLDLRQKGAPEVAPARLVPWFQFPGRRTQDVDVVFGHWSTLGQIAWPAYRVHGLDTGCVWGGRLTALELETGRLHQVPSLSPLDPQAAD